MSAGSVDLILLTHGYRKQVRFLPPPLILLAPTCLRVAGNGVLHALIIVRPAGRPFAAGASQSYSCVVKMLSEGDADARSRHAGTPGSDLGVAGGNPSANHQSGVDSKSNSSSNFL